MLLIKKWIKSCVLYPYNRWRYQVRFQILHLNIFSISLTVLGIVSTLVFFETNLTVYTNTKKETYIFAHVLSKSAFLVLTKNLPLGCSSSRLLKSYLPVNMPPASWNDKRFHPFLICAQHFRKNSISYSMIRTHTRVCYQVNVSILETLARVLSGQSHTKLFSFLWGVNITLC